MRKKEHPCRIVLLRSFPKAGSSALSDSEMKSHGEEGCSSVHVHTLQTQEKERQNRTLRGGDETPAGKDPVNGFRFGTVEDDLVPTPALGARLKKTP